MKKTVYVCDRCKKEFEPENIVELKISRMNVFDKWMVRNSRYDLCKACFVELKQFLKGEAYMEARVNEAIQNSR